MTDNERMEFRRQLGQAIIALQDHHRHLGPDVLLPELVAALVSLAAYVAHDNMNCLVEQFEDLCKQTMKIEWDKPDNTTLQ